MEGIYTPLFSSVFGVWLECNLFGIELLIPQLYLAFCHMNSLSDSSSVDVTTEAKVYNRHRGLACAILGQMKPSPISPEHHQAWRPDRRGHRSEISLSHLSTEAAQTIGRRSCVSMAGMNKVPDSLKRALYAWLRQPKEEMDRRQDTSEIQPLFPKK